MKISVITAIYNAADTLEQCVDSVLNQDYPHVEYILVDGASTDGSLNIIKAKAAQHPCLKWVSEPDSGIYDALNKGITMATGDVLGFLHADDQFTNPTCLSAIVAAFKQHGVEGVYGDLCYVRAQKPDKLVRNWKSESFKRALLNRGWMPAHPTLYLKTKLYQQYGSFDTSYRIAADYEFVLRIFKQPHLRFYYLPKTLVHMRTGGASNKSFKNLIQKSKEDYRALKQHNLDLPRKILFWKNVSKVPQFFSK